MSAVTDPYHAPGSLRGHGEAIREIVLAGLAALAYFGVRNLTAGSAATAFANADRIMRFEDATHLDWERSLQARIAGSATLTDVVNWVYIWGHWPVVVTVAIVLFLRRRERYRLLRNAILISGGIGFLFFALFPVAPPRLADPALLDTVTLHSHAYRALQPPGLTDQYAAFPSLHFGWNLLVGVAVWGATRNLAARMLAVIGPAAMAAAVVLTANHFVVDILAGFLVALIGLTAQRLFASLEPDSTSEAPVIAERAGRPSRRASRPRSLDPAESSVVPHTASRRPLRCAAPPASAMLAPGKEVANEPHPLDSVSGAGGLPAPDPAPLRGHRLLSDDAAGRRCLRARRRVLL